MKIASILFVCTGLASIAYTSTSTGKLLFVFDIAMHGSSAPEHSLTGVSYTEAPGDLTNMGVQ